MLELQNNGNSMNQYLFCLLCVCVCVLYETVNDSGELTSVTTRSMSAANNSYSMSSDNYEDERLLMYIYI